MARRLPRGYTLASLLVSQAIFLLVLSAVISGHFLGLRLFSTNQVRLAAANDLARSFSQFIADVRSAKAVRLGQGDLTSFTEVGRDAPQQGGAIQLYPAADTNSFIRYYLDAADNRLKRRAANGVLSIIAESVSNRVVFAAESPAGQLLTNRQSQCVIAMNLSFYAFGKGGQPVGAGNHFCEYRLQTRVASQMSD
jgi:hypothetical protein